MQIEIKKKRKKKEDISKDNFLNEDFISKITQLNQNIDLKKLKYENLNDLLTYKYDKIIFS